MVGFTLVTDSCVGLASAHPDSHCGLAIYIKMYLNAKEELWKLVYFTTIQNNNLKKCL
jgi:hypothetical protein